MEKAFDVVRDVCMKKSKANLGKYYFVFVFDWIKWIDKNNIFIIEEVKGIRTGVWTGKEQKVNYLLQKLE